MMKLFFEYIGEGKSVKVELAEYNTKTQKFYEKFGFKDTGERKDYEIVEGKFVPLMIMIKE